nr:MAG TPA: hypothetical protein [Caudoviricetes sp.]DAP51411.1 MAG TPA: hypothetical protein [Caudoviricetes sp.]
MLFCFFNLNIFPPLEQQYLLAKVGQFLSK